MTLREKQSLFSRLFIRLGMQAELWAYRTGGDFVIEEMYRHPSATHGHPNSTHRNRLAGHILLFDKDRQFLSDTPSYTELGEWWEKQHPLCRWGGRFSDGNHFSLEHNGVR